MSRPQFLITILFFALIPPSLLTSLPSLGALIKVLSLVILFLLLIIAFRTHIKLPLVLNTYVVWRLTILFPTIANEGDLALWGFTTVSMAAVILFFAIQVSKGRNALIQTFAALALLFTCYLWINCAQVVFAWSIGLDITQTSVNPGYLLGIRTRVTETILLAVTCSLVTDRVIGRRLPKFTFVALVPSIIQVSLLEVATAWVALFVFALGMILTFRVKLLYSLTFLSGLIVSFLVTTAFIQSTLWSPIANYFGKSITLTGRTDIWLSAWPHINEAPLWGHGINRNFGNFVAAFDGSLWQAHNQLLQLLYDCGWLGLLFFVLFVLTPIASHSPKKIQLSGVTSATMFSFSSVMITEIFTYNMALFILIPILHYYARILDTNNFSQDNALPQTSDIELKRYSNANI